MRRTIASAAVLLASLLSVHAADSTCYRFESNKPQAQNSGWFECNSTATHPGGAQLCCLSGSQCGEDSICRSDSTKTGESRYYVGGCTDPQYKDSVCRKDCTQYKQTFITWQSNEWQCCGNSGCGEGKNGDETFSAISPSQFSPAGSPSNSSSNDGLGLGDKIGIAVGAGVALLALITGVVFCCRARTKRTRINGRGVRGRYEEIGRRGRGDVVTGPPYGTREISPQPYGRSTSPMPPVHERGGRDRSRSIALDDRVPLPGNTRRASEEGLTARDI